jgi:hypothetical protein
MVRVAFALVTMLGCGTTDVIAEVVRDGSTAGSGAPGAPPASAELGAWCRGEGGLWITRRDGVRSLECANRLAASSFPRAVCACNSLLGPGTLSTASIGPDGALESTGASIAADGSGAPLVAPGASAPDTTLPVLQIGGDATFAGTVALRLGPGMQVVSGDLRSGPVLSASAGQTTVRIGGDASLPSASGLDPRALQVGGDLVLTPATSSAAEMQRWADARVGGQTQTADVNVAPECPCDLEQRIDVQATVNAAADHNDDALLGFAPEELYFVSEDRTISLPCGRFYFATINGTGVLTVRIDQPVAIFVGDYLGWIEVELGPAGSLDLFVSGVFQPRGGVFGNRERPAASRIYVHDQPGPGPIAFIGDMVSNFYGPTIGVQAFNSQRRGSMVVRDMIVTDSQRVEYDPRATDLGACGAQP